MKDYNWRALTQATTCRILGCQPQTINKWVGEGCPTGTADDGSKTYDCEKIVKWRIEHALREAHSVEGSPEMGIGAGTDNSEQLERYRKLKADMTEFDLAVKKKKYIEMTTIRAMVRKMAERTRIGFQSLGKRLSIKLAAMNDPKEVETLFDLEIGKILKELSIMKIENFEEDEKPKEEEQK